MARPSAPPAVRWIARTLAEAGHDTWAVGGAIRDVLAGRPSGDWDLTTQARPEEVQRLFKRTVPIGIDHGTVGVLARDGTLFEVTTFRKDVATDGRHAVVDFADTIEDDLARRDFTINAIAWHPLEEKILDPYDGLTDLDSGVLRTVGAAADRFAEDHLRILRAFRFAGLFDLTIDEATWNALRAAVERLTELSPERVREELLKVLDADRRPSGALRLYAESGALEVLYGELEALRVAGGASAGDRWTSTLASLDALPTGHEQLRLAALLHELAPGEAGQLLVRLRLSNAQVDEAARRAAAAPLPEPDAGDVAFRRWLSTNGPERLNTLARLELARARAGSRAPGRDPTQVVESWRCARRVRASGAPLAISELALDGRDLIRLGLRPGPDFGRILDELLEFVLEDPSRNEREALEAHVAAAGSSRDE